VCVFASKSRYSAAFVRSAIAEQLAQVEATEIATTVIHLGKADIDRFTALIPSPAVLHSFNRICQPWYDRIVAGKRDVRATTELRDALLPMLVSGALRPRATA
jgi:type I restriction enzyme S subunit